ILRDTTPPEIVSTLLSSLTTDGGEIIRILASTIDAGVGMARSGSFVIEVNGRSFKGILKNTGREKYNFIGNIFIPPDVSGSVRIQEIQLYDLIGNVTVGLKN
ncbi:MAG: hypothetical protein D3924_20240, partial [Candidatus Electrothrix sp. AR4]|nr:hypothetical protein [Candidatus Electrothrix sp. AR4]